ncbi:MAG TPA: AAA family ATPase [Acetobacteraceae bacterium]
MRLLSLTLENYGIFQAQRIAFDPAPGCINLLIAPNGAGKSILRNAFCDLLFGIHGQTPMGFRYGYGRMRLMAEAVAPDGTKLVFGRRKGQGNTLIGADSATLDPGELAAALGHTDRTLVERLFALDTERLREGGRELLASNGSVADALLSAAGGLRRARQVHQSLLNARDSLAPLRKAQARPFYQSLDRMLEARQRLSTTLLKPEMREKQDIELAHLRAEQEKCNKLAGAASQGIARLERIRRVVGVLAEHDAAVAWLDAHPDSPELPANAGERLAKAQDEMLRAEQFLERERHNREPIAEQLAHVKFDTELIAQGEAIELLIDRAGAARQAVLDIPKREAELALTMDRVGGILRQLGSPLPMERAAEAIPPRAAVLHARRLATEHAKLRAALSQLPAELAQAGKDVAATDSALAELPPVVDTRGLMRLLREIRGVGEPDRRAQELRQTVADRHAKLTDAVLRVRGWSQGPAALIALPVMPAETYERLHTALAAAETTLAASAKDVADLRNAVDIDKQRLNEIASGQPLPDESAIAAAREHRDTGWRLIYRRAFSTDPPDAAQENLWAGAQTLPLAYEHAVTAADELADRRNREGERVAQAAELTRRIAVQQARIVTAEAAHATANARRDAARLAWQEACAALAMPADASIAEPRALLAGRDRVIDADGEYASASREQASLEQRHALWAGRLAAELERPGENGACDLPELLALADERIEANKRADDARTRLQERLAAQRASREDKTTRLRAAEADLAAVMLEWAQVRQTLQRPDTEDPSTTIELLELLNELDSEQQSSGRLRHRLREMQDEIAVFRTAAADLATRLAPDLAADDAFAVVQALRQRLTEHRALAKQHETLAAALKRADTALARQQKQLDDCRVERGTVLAMIGSETVEAAQVRVAFATEHARMVEAVRRGERELHEKGDGRPVSQLRAEAASIPVDDIPSAIEMAQVEHDAANRDAQALAARVATARADMDAQALADTATQAATDQQSAVAALRRITEEATLMHLAALLLDASLTQVEIAGTSVLLSRIAELFRTITGGAYTRLEVDDPGDGSAGLIAVQGAFPDERKAVADLSEGERDQLFLALRLAAIEDHVATAQPLPFVCDDILQTFDDDRAMAAMQALVLLSESVQVILLSHHRHLAGLSARLAPERIHLCEMRAGMVA